MGVAVITRKCGIRVPLPQRGALQDTEFVLFVDDHQTQSLKRQILLDHRLRSDQQVDVTAGQFLEQQRATPWWTSHRTRYRNLTWLALSISDSVWKCCRASTSVGAINTA